MKIVFLQVIHTCLSLDNRYWVGWPSVAALKKPSQHWPSGTRRGGLGMISMHVIPTGQPLWGSPGLRIPRKGWDIELTSGKWQRGYILSRKSLKAGSPEACYGSITFGVIRLPPFASIFHLPTVSSFHSLPPGKCWENSSPPLRNVFWFLWSFCLNFSQDKGLPALRNSDIGPGTPDCVTRNLSSNRILLRLSEILFINIPQ